jgi:CelD/BcsL family acetyltransferase involved in cellulose biosynthesis
MRQEVRRLLRRADDAGIRFREVDPDDVERALHALWRLHHARWGTSSSFLRVFDAFAAAARAGVAHGEVRFLEVVADEEPIASMVTLELAGRCWWYQMGRDPDRRWSGIGTVLKAHATARSCRLGHQRVDLCQGRTKAKLVWADEADPVLELCWSRGAAGRAAEGFLGAVEPRARLVRDRIVGRVPGRAQVTENDVSVGVATLDTPSGVVGSIRRSVTYS